MNKLETLGERVKRLRKHKGLTQDQLMLLVGVRQATISRLEKGFNAAILSSTLERLAQALGTTPEYLLKGDTKSAANPEREILEIFRELDPKFLEAWIAQGRAWKKKTVKAKQTEPA